MPNDSQLPSQAPRPVTITSNATEDLLANVLTDELTLRVDFRRRRDPCVYKKVHPADVEGEIAKGWEVNKKGKTGVKMSKAKPHDVWLEDQVWCLLRRMRYPILNGQRFRLQYRRPDGSSDSKQIDVFAKDDETVLIIECKSREVRGRKALTKDLTETQSLQRPISDVIRRVYGAAAKLQIVWIYVTEKIIWSEPDLERANAINVRVITENELRYYAKFIQHLGPAGRYQFLAELLQNKNIAGLEGIKVPAVRGKLGKHVFYSFVIPARHLLKISFVNHQALNHPDGAPSYQRMISSSRLKEIGEFIKAGGFFPTNILINFVNGCRYEPLPKDLNTSSTLKFCWLHLPSTYRSAWIIDGQHRLYGYSRLDDTQLNQSLFVLAFDRLDRPSEADLFVTINNKQKSVPPTILESLKADLNWGSADSRERIGALASQLIKTMNGDSSSPFFQRFAMEGLEGAEEVAVTIGEVAKGLSRAGLLGKTIQKSYVLGPLSGATDDDTLRRARRVLNSYFALIRESNEERWENGKSGFVLNNPGIRAYLLLLAEVFRYWGAEKHQDADLMSESEILTELSTTMAPVMSYLKTASDEDVQTKFSRRFGEGGVRDYFYNLCALIQQVTPNFGGEDLRKWLAETNEARKAAAHADVIKLNEAITDFVFDTLKKVHGTHEVAGSGEKAYWELGVESAKTKEEAYKRQQQEPLNQRKSREVYVDTIELKNIVRQKNNWEHFSNVFNLPRAGEKGKVYYLDWMDDFNKIRRIPAHSSSQRVYDEADYEFISWLKSDLWPKLSNAKASLKN